MSFIEIQSVNKHYGLVQALFEVSLSIQKGEFVTLLGPSGSGKTTLLKILAGFDPVTSGVIQMEGRDITAVPPEKRNFGLVFQGYALFPHMTVADNIAYPLKVRRRPRAEIAEQVQSMLNLVQLGKFANRKPQELSGGQQQRVALARALVFRPDLLLLDEPMSALDKKLRFDLQEELRDIHRRLGTTFINVTHDQEEAMHMSDRIAVMDHGRIQQFDAAFALYRKPANRFVASFIGKSNFLEGRIAQGRFRSGDIALDLPGAPAEGSVALMLRPEDVALCPGPTGDGNAALPADVISATYTGDRAIYTVSVGPEARFLVYGTARTGLIPEGTRVHVTFDPQDCLLLR